ncbi:glycosyltransferase family 2 protein [Microvirga calopogonii]|uniref:glycosyltransferase family 2 protein n=1 Tax=Microvirga calopogonii TaxID=2078013 RepID=UPI0013B3C3EB|nr:glycosyltransferase family 2 protein [Microvirga calopogonii]
MSNKPDITVTIICHAEGSFVVPALSSMADQVATARAGGLTVETRAILDRPDPPTRHLVATSGAWLDGVEEVMFGDLGLSRNAGARAAHGEFLAFLDGDDLWGANWLQLAHKAATAPSVLPEVIWHPQFLFYFTESDFDRHSPNCVPHSAARAHYMEHSSSEDPGFRRETMFLNNVWSANVFAARSLHERYPYSAVDRAKGFGIEDWAWHMETLWAGVAHNVVADTVHMIRLKDTGSLAQQNTVEGLLPPLPSPRCDLPT